jgi:hypothetical protein
MVSKERQKKLDYVKAIHDNYTIIIAKHPRFSWMHHSEGKYIYFVYITRSQKRFVDNRTAHVADYNILCFQNFYSSFEKLMKVIEPVLSEYILNNTKLFQIAMLCEELRELNEDPLHRNASGE